jgi:hypothetical protein
MVFVSKNIVQTSMREDVFGTFAQMKHLLLRRSCSNNALMREKCTRFVNNYYHTVMKDLEKSYRRRNKIPRTDKQTKIVYVLWMVQSESDLIANMIFRPYHHT